MLRLGRAVFYFIAGIISGVLLRWQYVRTSRQAAPHPDSLVRNPDRELSITRQDDTLKIEWSKQSHEVKIYLGTSFENIQSQAMEIVQAQQSLILRDIDPTKRYFAELHFDDGTILQGAERIMPLKSFPNFRDIGGYKTKDGRRVRWNYIFRGGSLDNLSDDDLGKLQELNVQVVCDVRTTEEMLNHPDRLSDEMHLINIPPVSNDNPWEQLGRILLQRNYLETALHTLYTYVLIDNNPQMFAAIFQRLADEANLPMIIHCAAGKDRSGTMIAVLLKLLGVPDEIIVADYTLSNYSFNHSRKAANRAFESLKLFGLREEDLAYLLIAPPQVMAQTLYHIDKKYGSVEAYLCEYVGLSPESLHAIRENLLE